jgi:hypothetical protein
MNLNVENYQVNDPTKKLTLINPNVFPSQELNTSQVPEILPVFATNKISIRNMLYDEEFILEEPSSAELESAGETERAAEDAYDQAYMKLIQEKFPKIYPPELPKSETIEPENMKNLRNDNNFFTRKINEFTDKIGNGKFEYISNKYEKEMLVNAWQAITFTHNWDFVAQDISSFMWSNDPSINVIAMKMQELGYDGHSGCSFGLTMRNMQYLVKHGEEKFKQLFGVTDNQEEVEPYENEDAMEYEERLKQLIKRREDNKKREDKLLDYMGGY